ncbi:MAG: UDP-3-O-(3-hydroxymyristoyl)glucosamine N-acyltransferase [Phycisphaerales bacterium]
MLATTIETTLTISAGELADLIGGTLEGPRDLPLKGVAPIETGSPGDLTFIRAQSFAKLWSSCNCSAALVTESVTIPDHDPSTRALIRVPDAEIAFAQVLGRLDPGISTPPVGTHPSASIDPSARIDPQASIGPNCTIGPHVELGAGSILIANVYLGADSRVGSNSLLHPGVVVGDRCTLGDRCIVHPNAVIGADGFGFIPPTADRPAIRVPQIGHVIIGDDCEIGAGTTIDRAKLGVTSLGDRIKIDNLVHIGHNCTIGDDSILCGRTTLGGSVTVGKRVMFGGAVTISDQVTIEDNARVAGGSIAMDTIPAGETYAGTPAMPARTALANYAAFKGLADFTRRVDKALAKLNKAQDDRSSNT